MTQVERAVSGRASCKACSAKIAKGELRIGVEAYGDFGPYVKWHHAACYAIASSGARSLRGYNFLDAAGRAELDRLARAAGGAAPSAGEATEDGVATDDAGDHTQ